MQKNLHLRAKKLKLYYFFVAKNSTKRKYKKSKVISFFNSQKVNKKENIKQIVAFKSQKARKPGLGSKPKLILLSLIFYNLIITSYNQGLRKTVLLKTSQKS